VWSVEFSNRGEVLDINWINRSVYIPDDLDVVGIRKTCAPVGSQTAIIHSLASQFYGYFALYRRDFFFLKGPAADANGRTAALRHILQPCDEDD
jgi:hypothetical protein